jgi:transcription elongation factor Elf1
MTSKVCKNCGQRVVFKNFALGQEWIHQPVGSSFMDDQYTYCRKTVAEENRPDSTEALTWRISMSDCSPIITCLVCGHRSFGDSAVDAFRSAWSHSAEKHNDLF